MLYTPYWKSETLPTLTSNEQITVNNGNQQDINGSQTQIQFFNITILSSISIYIMKVRFAQIMFPLDWYCIYRRYIVALMRYSIATINSTRLYIFRLVRIYTKQGRITHCNIFQYSPRGVHIRCRSQLTNLLSTFQEPNSSNSIDIT